MGWYSMPPSGGLRPGWLGEEKIAKDGLTVPLRSLHIVLNVSGLLINFLDSFYGECFINALQR